MNFGLSLGLATPSIGAGHLNLRAETPSVNLSKPEGLEVPFERPGVSVIEATGRLAQVKAAQGLVHVAVKDQYEYQLQCFHDSDLPRDANGEYVLVNGLYQTNSTHPAFVTWIVRNPDGGNASNRLELQELRNGVGRTCSYVYTAASNRWDRTSPGGKPVSTTWRQAVSADVTNFCSVIRDNATELRKTVRTYYYAGPGAGMLLTGEVEGLGTTLRTNTYVYYPATAGVSANKLRRVQYASGDWRHYIYDTQGRTSAEYAPWGNSPPPADPTAEPTTGDFKLTTRAYELTLSGDGTLDPGTYFPGTPRKTTVEVRSQGSTYLVSKTYQAVTCTLDGNNIVSMAAKEIRECNSPAALWDDPENLRRRTVEDASGRPVETGAPDGTSTVFSYDDANHLAIATQQSPSGQGTETTTVTDELGLPLSRTVRDLATMTVLSHIQHTYTDAAGNYLDPLRRSHDTVDMLTGEVTQYRQQGCCGVDYVVTPDGVATHTEREPTLNRVVGTRSIIPAGGTALIVLRQTNVLDAAGMVVGKFRVGSSNNVEDLIIQECLHYDVLGRLTSTTNALGGVASYTESTSPDGMRLETVTHPDGGTIIKAFYRDGSLATNTGTATFGERYEQGANATNTFTKAIKLNADGTDTPEWTLTFQDMLGHHIKTVYPDNSTNYFYYNAKGQLWKQVDPDGVVRLHTYNSLGGQEFSIAAISSLATNLASYDALLDSLPTLMSGVDRITQTRRTVLAADENLEKPDRVLVETLVWQDGQAQGTVVSATETSTDGMKTWRITQPEPGKWLTNRTVTVPGQNGSVTTFSPDGSHSTATYSYGRQASLIWHGATGVAIGATTYGYDLHGRRNTVTDSRNGTTTYGFNNSDLVTSITTPAPGNGPSPQTTRTYYDGSLRATNVVQADGAGVVTEYYPNGLRKRTSGAREYPVEYAYDYAGRVKTMTTWQEYPSTGQAVTTWNYNSQRGWLSNKRYQDAGQGALGPDYTHTPGGRMLTRVWARGNPRVTTTYSYNLAGELESMAYSDGTTGAAYAHDRLGHRKTITQGGMVTTLHNSLGGQSLSEAHAGGVLDGLSVTNGWDQFMRHTSLVLLRGASTVLAMSTNSYNAAGRVDTVGDGTVSATYLYLANSPLVDQISFKQGTTPVMTTTKTHDRLNRLLSVASAPSASSAVASGYSYNDANQRTRRSEADSTYWVYGYDPLGQVKSGKRYWQDGTAVAGQQFEYTHDNIGNRTSTRAGGDENGQNLRTASYQRNLLNQYTSREVPGGLDVMGAALPGLTVSVNTQAPYRKGEYFRKELAVANPAGPVWQAITVATNGLAAVGGNVWVPRTPEAFACDLDGNLTSDGRWNYTWDGENRLVRMVAITVVGPQQRLDFAYDHQGRRITKRVWNNTTGTGALAVDQKFLYDGWNLVAELNATNNTVVRSHVWGLDLSGSLQGAGGVGGLLWLRDTSTFNNQPSTHFASYDGNGNVTMLVNAADGTETARYEYGPFGELLRATGPMARANPFRFSTKYQDDETDLLMYALRPYSPPTGRFLCKDPIGEHGGRNLYGFVGNDPLDRFDPLGLMSVDDFNNGVTSISEGLNDIGFLEGALRWFFGSGRDVHVPFKNYDPDWGPSDFDGFDAAVKSVCSKCPTWQPGLEFTRVRDLYMEGGKTIFIKGGPGRINVRLKGNMSSFAHYCPCKWRFRGDVTIPRDSFNFDPQWFNSDRSGSGELITRIIWLIHLLGVGTDFNVYFDGSRFVDASGDCPKN